MNDILLQYFAGEKRESVFFIAAGVIAIVVGIVLIRRAGPFRGAAWPLIAIALIQIVVGATVFFRTDSQVAGLTQQLANDPAAYRAGESGRMQKVMSSFRLYKAIEIALIVTGIALLLLFKPPAPAAGIGMGLLLQSSLMLAMDILAEYRGAIYLAGIDELIR